MKFLQEMIAKKRVAYGATDRSSEDATAQAAAPNGRLDDAGQVQADAPRADAQVLPYRRSEEAAPEGGSGDPVVLGDEQRVDAADGEDANAPVALGDEASDLDDALAELSLSEEDNTEAKAEAEAQSEDDFADEDLRLALEADPDAAFEDDDPIDETSQADVSDADGDDLAEAAMPVEDDPSLAMIRGLAEAAQSDEPAEPETLSASDDTAAAPEAETAKDAAFDDAGFEDDAPEVHDPVVRPLRNQTLSASTDRPSAAVDDAQAAGDAPIRFSDEQAEADAQPDHPAAPEDETPAAASAPASPKIWDLGDADADKDDDNDLTSAIARAATTPEAAPPVRRPTPQPVAASPASRRAGRVKTRLLGFHDAEETGPDPFAATRAPAAAAEPAESPAQAAPAVSFPVGWIVVTKGPGRGASYELPSGVSQIGRGADQSVRLDFGDNSISRDNHAAIAFDDEQQKFFLGHGGKSNLVRLNGMPVLSTEALTHGDSIRIGETTLRFVALCGADFAWNAE